MTTVSRWPKQMQSGQNEREERARESNFQTVRAEKKLNETNDEHKRAIRTEFRIHMLR